MALVHKLWQCKFGVGQRVGLFTGEDFALGGSVANRATPSSICTSRKLRIHYPHSGRETPMWDRYVDTVGPYCFFLRIYLLKEFVPKYDTNWQELHYKIFFFNPPNVYFLEVATQSWRRRKITKGSYYSAQLNK